MLTMWHFNFNQVYNDPCCLFIKRLSHDRYTEERALTTHILAKDEGLDLYLKISPDIF